MALQTIDLKKTPIPARQDVWPALRQEIDRMFTRFANNFDGLPLNGGPEIWPRLLRTPVTGFEVAVDVAEDDKAYRVTAELPGLDIKDVDVAVTGEVLTIKGEKHTETEEKDQKHFLSERTFGAFERSFTLPEDADAAHIEAQYAKGVLTLVLPKNPKAVPPVQKITVKAA